MSVSGSVGGDLGICTSCIGNPAHQSLLAKMQTQVHQDKNAKLSYGTTRWMISIVFNVSASPERLQSPWWKKGSSEGDIICLKITVERPFKQVNE